MAALELNTEAFLRICTPDPVNMVVMVMNIMEKKFKMMVVIMATPYILYGDCDDVSMMIMIILTKSSTFLHFFLLFFFS